MPIRPENKVRYPKNWYEISQRIRYEHAHNCCEKCRVKNHALGGRTREGTFLPAHPNGDDGLSQTWPIPGE